jgi:pyruvate kinase
MVARWDLWIEVPIEKLAVYQKMIVGKCRAKWKFVVTATHLLETMIENPFPTRAESSDVFNSVLQWADSLMLSWETAMWKFPIESVEMMTKIIREAEKNVSHAHDNFSNDWLSKRDIEKKALIRSAVFIGEELKAKAIIILTKTWLLAKLASAFRPNMDVYSFTNNEKSVRTMNVLYAVKPFHLVWWNKDNYNETLELAINELKSKGLIKNWQKLVAINDIQKNGIEIPGLPHD